MFHDVYIHAIKSLIEKNGYTNHFLVYPPNYKIAKLLSVLTTKFPEVIVQQFHKKDICNYLNKKDIDLKIDYNFYDTGDNGDIFYDKNKFIAVKSMFCYFKSYNIDCLYTGITLSILEKLQKQYKNKEQICVFIIHKYDKQNYVNQMVKYIKNEEKLCNFILNTIYKNYKFRIFKIKDIPHIKENIEQFLESDKYFI